jgi:hypothetical protein
VENVHDESVLSSYPSYSSKQEVEKVEKVDDNKLEVPNTVIRSARLPPRVLGPGLVVVASSRARVIQSFRRIGSSESVLFDEDDVVGASEGLPLHGTRLWATHSKGSSRFSQGTLQPAEIDVA